ncbi:MAG: hypothetical protein WC509_03890 [Candidatus Izemoplasmatales bacterium]
MDGIPELRKFLEPRLRACPGVLAAHEGGSAATGFSDRYSDLDLEVVCEDDAVETVIALVRAALDERYGIEREYRVPEPAWHGFSQAFYKLKGLAPFVYVDLAVIKVSIPDKFEETDRHGRAVVWFEKESVLSERISSAEAIDARGRRLFRQATATDFLMLLEARKNIARGRFVEAFPNFFRYLVAHVGVLLNLKHRPAKADFGVRYAYRDYPEADRLLVEDAMKVSSLAELSAMLDRLEARFEELKAELSGRWS